MGAGRVYLPVTRVLLERARAEGRFEPPLHGHAVTTELVAELPGADQEELEYAAMQGAALDALTSLGPDDRPRRLVAAADVAEWSAVDEPDDAPTLVEVTVPVPWRRLAAVHADAPDAEDDVRAAARALSDGADEDAPEVQRCLEHELGWYAVQELDQLLEG